MMIDAHKGTEALALLAVLPPVLEINIICASHELDSIVITEIHCS